MTDLSNLTHPWSSIPPDKVSFGAHKVQVYEWTLEEFAKWLDEQAGVEPGTGMASLLIDAVKARGKGPINPMTPEMLPFVKMSWIIPLQKYIQTGDETQLQVALMQANMVQKVTPEGMAALKRHSEKYVERQKAKWREEEGIGEKPRES
jgi:hypothetical protein